MFFSRLKFGKKLRAETILEVIVALFVVALGSTAATTLVISAMRSNELSKDNLVALNLAVEGIEGMREIRDTNWLKYSSNKVDCWNLVPTINSADIDCNDPSYLIQAGNYTIDFNPLNFRWFLTPAAAGTTLDLDNAGSPSNDSTFQLHFIDDQLSGTDQDLYLSKNAVDIYCPGCSRGTSRYYRMIKVIYPSAAAPLPPETAQYMQVESLVQWQAEGVVHQVKLSSILTNYQKVKVNP